MLGAIVTFAICKLKNSGKKVQDLYEEFKHLLPFNGDYDAPRSNIYIPSTRRIPPSDSRTAPEQPAPIYHSPPLPPAT